MYQLVVKDKFAAAHQLRHYEGKCENLHGHNFQVHLMVEAERVNSTGMAIDFKILKAVLHEILNELDHHFLNEHSAFIKENPSSENLARYIFHKAQEKINNEEVKVGWVRVYESDEAYAQFFE
ncbi:MAG: 6-carboxytetrahydropterin synthase QueD [bacterium]